MAPVRDTGTILIRIENIVPFRSTLVESEIFPSYPGYLEGVAHCLARSLQLFRVAHQTRHGVVHGDLERVRFDYYTFNYGFETTQGVDDISAIRNIYRNLSDPIGE